MKKGISRIVAVLLCMVLGLSLAGCAAPSAEPSEPAAKPVAEAAAPASEAAQEPAAAETEAEPAEVIEMRLATSVAEDHPMNLAALEFARLVGEKSNGRIKITVYHGRQLGQDAEVAEMVMQGSLDFVEISSIIFANYTELANAWQIPFLFSDMEQYRKTIKSEANQVLLDAITAEGLGIKALAIYNTGFRHIVTNGPDVTDVTGMQKLKIRTAESEMFLEMFDALQAAPTPMAYGEVYSGLQNKVVDACEADYSAIYLEKFYEVASSMTELKHFMWPGLLAVNEAKFASLSAEDQAIIQEAAVEVYDYNVDNIIECEANYKELLEAEGFKINVLTDEAFAGFQDVVSGVVEKYSAINPLIADFVAEAQNNA